MHLIFVEAHHFHPHRRVPTELRFCRKPTQGPTVRQFNNCIYIPITQLIHPCDEIGPDTPYDSVPTDRHSERSSRVPNLWSPVDLRELPQKTTLLLPDLSRSLVVQHADRLSVLHPGFRFAEARRKETKRHDFPGESG